MCRVALSILRCIIINLFAGEVMKGTQVRRTRKALGLSQSQFAKRLRISRSHLSNIENGWRKVVDKDLKARIKAAK
jgi:DNA-binding transcriptional regulator YiaG